MSDIAENRPEKPPEPPRRRRTTGDVPLDPRSLAVLEEKQKLEDRCAAIEQRLYDLSNLYTATFLLHGTLRRNGVLSAIQEIVTNFMGSEEIEIVEVDESLSAVQSIFVFGIAEERRVRGLDRYERVGRSLRAGTTVTAADDGCEGEPGDGDVAACIPLLVDGRAIGAVVVHRFLAHRPPLADLDRELAKLLSIQGGAALRAASLAERANSAQARPC